MLLLLLYMAGLDVTQHWKFLGRNTFHWPLTCSMNSKQAGRVAAEMTLSAFLLHNVCCCQPERRLLTVSIPLAEVRRWAVQDGHALPVCVGRGHASRLCGHQPRHAGEAGLGGHPGQLWPQACQHCQVSGSICLPRASCPCQCTDNPGWFVVSITWSIVLFERCF